MSILVFFLRFFSAPKVRAATHGVLAFIILANGGLVGMQIFQCMPIEANWEAWRSGYSEPFQCINDNSFAIAVAGLNILQELMLITLAMPALAQLNLSRRAKLSAVGMFTVGILTIMMNAIRLAFIIPTAGLPNITWDYTDAIIWSGIDTAFALIIPCLPAVHALLNHWLAAPALSQPSPQGSIQSHQGQEPLGGKFVLHVCTTTAFVNFKQMGSTTSRFRTLGTITCTPRRRWLQVVIRAAAGEHEGRYWQRTGRGWRRQHEWQKFKEHDCQGLRQRPRMKRAQGTIFSQATCTRAQL
jgi:hypothetical protein